MKVFIVMEHYRDESWWAEPDHVTIEKVFDSRDKAIDYIHGCILERINEAIVEGLGIDDFAITEDPGRDWIQDKLNDDGEIVYIDNDKERASLYIKEFEVE